MASSLFLYADTPLETNTSNFRIHIPKKYLRLAGHDIEEAPAWTQDYYDKVPDVVLLERLATVDRVEKLRMAGAKRLILTFDDNYSLLPLGSLGHDYWKGQRNIDVFRKALSLVDLAIVPSPLLAKDFARYCKQILVVPNYHDPELFDFDKPKPTGTLRIGWGGSGQHRETWEKSAVLGGLRSFAVNHTDFIVVVCGANISDLMESAGIPYEYRPWIPLEEWVKTVASFDIGLAPLSGEYDKRRSNLRSVEYGLCRVPWIGSNVEVYQNCAGGILVKDEPKYWREVLNNLANSPRSRLALADQGEAWAKTYTMDKHVGTYERILWGEK